MKRALIFDLDNTIYPVSSITEHLFQDLFSMIGRSSSGINDEDQQAVKHELTRRPFHLVADKYNFSDELKQYGTELLKNAEYDLPIQAFNDYHSLILVPYRRFLVTIGFTKLQRSKIKMLDIAADFDEIHIVDPELSKQTKKDVFVDIMNMHGYNPEDLLVIGDDPDSEIKAATECGIDTFLFDPEDRYQDVVVTFKSDSLKDILKYL